MTRYTNAIDALVGSRLKELRLTRGMSQGQVAEGLKVRFQQVQKYEKGENRITAGRLWDLSLVLKVPITDFFLPPGGAFEPPAIDHSEIDVLLLVRTFRGIQSTEVRKKVLNLINTMSENSAALPNGGGRVMERIDRVAIKHLGLLHTAEAPHRHHDVICEMAKLGFGPECMHNQGFVTDTGRFVDRKEAYRIAGIAGQIKKDSHASMTHGLFSEDLW